MKKEENCIKNLSFLPFETYNTTLIIKCQQKINYFYVLFNLIGGYLTNKYLIFLLGFVIATVMCFVIS